MVGQGQRCWVSLTPCLHIVDDRASTAGGRLLHRIDDLVAIPRGADWRPTCQNTNSKNYLVYKILVCHA